MSEVCSDDFLFERVEQGETPPPRAEPKWYTLKRNFSLEEQSCNDLCLSGVQQEQIMIVNTLAGGSLPLLEQSFSALGELSRAVTLFQSKEQSCNKLTGETHPCWSRVIALALGNPFPAAETVTLCWGKYPPLEQSCNTSVGISFPSELYRYSLALTARTPFPSET